MSGHSKWKNIMHKKGKTDAQRASVFTKISKEIIIAVKAGGGDPNSNSKLRELIIKAKANNVPNDNIDRTIKKALGNDSTNYEEITYEGYGHGGVKTAFFRQKTGSRDEFYSSGAGFIRRVRTPRRE